MKRVMIVGQPGSGKSTLARYLGEKTGLPVVHIDQIHWKPGWVARKDSEKTILCQDVHRRDAWIFEGGHSCTWPERLNRCDTLIWLDFPLWLRFWRVISRTLREYGQSRLGLPENCPERFNAEFFRWIWQTRNSARVETSALYGGANRQKRCIKLDNREQVCALLNSLPAKVDLQSQATKTS